jgi:trigger factor
MATVLNDALINAVNDGLTEVVREEKVEVYTQPQLEVSKISETEFEATVKFALPPEVTFGQYKGLGIKEKQVKVLEKDIKAYIDDLKAQHSTMKVKNGEAKKGDIVIIDFVGYVDGEAFEGGDAKAYELELGSNSFVPGFEDQLVGAKSEDEVEVKVTFPENYHADLAGKDATFKCVVHEVKTKEVPTLNDEFVKELELEGVNTVEEYQEYVKNLLKDNKTKAAEQQFEQDCVEAVLKNSYAEFPQSLINQAVERNVARLEQQAKQYQVPVEILLQYYQMGTLEDFKKMSEEQVRKEFLQELVFEEIIKLEGFVATAEELEAKYLELAGGDLAKVKQVKKQYREAQVAFHINSLKVVELIKANAVTK